MSLILEEVLKDINTKCIKIDEDTRKRNLEELEPLLNKFINAMKNVDPLFRALYQTRFYCGSYYDNLKVGAPDEFNIDLKLVLPKIAKPTIAFEYHHGFVSVELSEYHNFEKQTDQFAKELKKNLLDSTNYLDNEKAIQWMQSMVDRVLQNYNFGNIRSCSIGKPATTLKIKSDDDDDVIFSVNLVPCIVFDGDEWPKGNFKKPANFNYLQLDEQKFFIVPKKPNKIYEHVYVKNALWRLSFPIQERKMFHDTERLKPAIKLIKKIRDVQERKSIKSYFINTIGLWLIDDNIEMNSFPWYRPTLSEIVITLLKELQKSIESRVIRYYWNKDFNLLGNVNAAECENISNNLKKIIKKMENPTSTSEIYGIFGCSQSFQSYADNSLMVSPRTETTSAEGIALGVAGVAALGIVGFSLYKHFSRNSNE